MQIPNTFDAKVNIISGKTNTLDARISSGKELCRAICPFLLGRKNQHTGCSHITWKRALQSDTTLSSWEEKKLKRRSLPSHYPLASPKEFLLPDFSSRVRIILTAASGAHLEGISALKRAAK
ncbi:hypothetical protein CDAR_400241 [Caerostris darwini]|uniref:Uncharacterized protein n=1 Tax=Caerostris darwini TaxID=1538125 RepID=A0AAV4SGV3_9ARAC|nr:hypothetical protein CDAR_400241 [Caerostris darwini]